MTTAEPAYGFSLNMAASNPAATRVFAETYKAAFNQKEASLRAPTAIGWTVSQTVLVAHRAGLDAMLQLCLANKATSKASEARDASQHKPVEKEDYFYCTDTGRIAIFTHLIKTNFGDSAYVAYASAKASLKPITEEKFYVALLLAKREMEMKMRSPTAETWIEWLAKHLSGDAEDAAYAWTMYTFVARPQTNPLHAQGPPNGKEVAHLALPHYSLLGGFAQLLGVYTKEELASFLNLYGDQFRLTSALAFTEKPQALKDLYSAAMAIVPGNRDRWLTALADALAIHAGLDRDYNSIGTLSEQNITACLALVEVLYKETSEVVATHPRLGLLLERIYFDGAVVERAQSNDLKRQYVVISQAPTEMGAAMMPGVEQAYKRPELLFRSTLQRYTQMYSSGKVDMAAQRIGRLLNGRFPFPLAEIKAFCSVNHSDPAMRTMLQAKLADGKWAALREALQL